MRQCRIILVVTLLLLAATSHVQASETEDLIAAASQEIKDLAMPYTSEYQIDYNIANQVLTVVFVTETGREPSYNLYYEVWWDCQFIALKSFQKRGLPVKGVGVVTNFDDGSGRMLAVTQAAYVEKYANAAYGMTKWIDLSQSFLWDEDTEEWVELAK